MQGGNHAVSRLLGFGAPLPDDVRTDMEERFRTSFGGVRVHDGPTAHALAASLNAEALTHGSDVVFGDGRFAPKSAEGRRLLAHELAHVVQQRRGGAAPSLERGSLHEVAADRAATETMSGVGPIAVQGGTGVGVARAESEAEPGGGDDAVAAMLNRIRRSVVDAIIAGAGYAGGPGDVLVAKAIEGLFDQMFTELWVEGKGKTLLFNLASLGPSGIAKAFGGYQLGILEGLASPLSDVLGTAVFGESAAHLSWTLLSSAYNHADEIGPELRDVIAKSQALAKGAATALDKFTHDPNALQALLSLSEAADKFAQQKAYELGQAGASKVISVLEAPWSAPEEASPAPEFSRWTAAAWVQSKLGTAHDWLVQSPGTKIGEAAGYAVGWVAIQVILLAVSTGVSGALKAAGSGLAKLGTVVARVSPVAGAALTRSGEFVILLGETARLIGEALNALKGTALQALRTFLAPVLDPLQALLESVLGVINKLRGAATREGGELVEAAGKVARLPGASDIGFEEAPTEVFTPEAKQKLIGEAKERAVTEKLAEIHSGSTDIEDWPEIVSAGAEHAVEAPSPAPLPSTEEIDIPVEAEPAPVRPAAPRVEAPIPESPSAGVVSRGEQQVPAEPFSQSPDVESPPEPLPRVSAEESVPPVAAEPIADEPVEIAAEAEPIETGAEAEAPEASVGIQSGDAPREALTAAEKELLKTFERKPIAQAPRPNIREPLVYERPPAWSEGTPVAEPGAEQVAEAQTRLAPALQRPEALPDLPQPSAEQVGRSQARLAPAPQPSAPKAPPTFRPDKTRVMDPEDADQLRRLAEEKKAWRAGWEGPTTEPPPRHPHKRRRQ
jgi:hypothetical protein